MCRQHHDHQPHEYKYGRKVLFCKGNGPFHNPNAKRGQK